MSLELLVLCAAAAALVGLLVSCAVGVALAGLDSLAGTLPPRARARWWLVVASLPLIVATLAVAVSLLPALGIGHDHCLAHGPHHPHLCVTHVGDSLGAVPALVALLFGLRLAWALLGLGRSLHASYDASERLAQASERHADALVFPSDEPRAFVLGTWQPRVHLSSGLMALGSEIVEPVIAHERIHAQKRDLLWRALFPMLALGHLPSVARLLRSRLSAAQELAADDEAATTLPDGRLRLASALVRLARGSRRPALGVSFTEGDLERRVHALLAAPGDFSRWPGRGLLLLAAVSTLAVGLSHDRVHHALETLLGALS